MSKHEFLTGNGNVIEVSVEPVGNDSLIVKVGNESYEFQPLGERQFSLTLNGTKSVAAVVRGKEGVYFIDIDSHLFEIREPSEGCFAGEVGGHAGEKDKVYAPMPGKVVKIMVEVGDQVTEKQALIVVEAMKMENQVQAKASGKVKAINFAPGDQVDTETALIELELGE